MIILIAIICIFMYLVTKFVVVGMITALVIGLIVIAKFLEYWKSRNLKQKKRIIKETLSVIRFTGVGLIIFLVLGCLMVLIAN